jgi:sterol 3beta-glucosyltransferase
MKVTVLTVGTRGDVQPYIALALGLRRDGHDVRFATFGEYRTLVESFGLDYAPIEGSISGQFTSEAGVAWQESGRNPVRYVRRQERVIGPLVAGVIRSGIAACQNADIVVGPPVAARVAERLDVPVAMTHMWPLARTRSFPSPLTWTPAPLRRSRTVNYLSYLVLERMLDPRRSRAGPGLFERLEHRRVPHLYSFSPIVVPKPPDWRPWHHVTGYWFLDVDGTWQPPADLADFLAAGPPPVYVGFGSAGMRHPAAVADTVIGALRRADQRGVLQGWWPGATPGPLGSDLFVVASIPHEWLFPRMAAVVHHGGAGTTGSGLRAGVPSIVVPFYADQPFWAWRVAALGAGPQPISFQRLSVPGLAAAVRRGVTDPAIRARAAAVGRRIRAEEGVARAVEAVRGALS